MKWNFRFFKKTKKAKKVDLVKQRIIRDNAVVLMEINKEIRKDGSSADKLYKLRNEIINSL